MIGVLFEIALNFGARFAWNEGGFGRLYALRTHLGAHVFIADCRFLVVVVIIIIIGHNWVDYYFGSAEILK
jgi:hypothetical protein